jgi:hypothetical protein
MRFPMVGLTVQFADRQEQPRINVSACSLLAGNPSDQTCSCHADPEPLAGEGQGSVRCARLHVLSGDTHERT